MLNTLVGLLTSLLVAVAPMAEVRHQGKGTLRTQTGWFSDSRCAREPAADELVRPNGTACVRRCLEEGAKLVFLSEQANTIFEVLDHSTAKNDVGYRVEVTAVVDDRAKSIRVRSVKRLSEVTALCLVPRKKTE